MRRVRSGHDSVLRLVSISAGLLLGCTGAGMGGGTGTGTGTGRAGDGVDLDRPGNYTGDTDDTGGGDGDADPFDDGVDDGAGDAGDACQTCIDQSCSAEYEACGASAECRALDECGQACADQACYTACEQQHPDGTTALFAFYDCLESSCAQPCGAGGAGEDGADGDAGGGDAGGGGGDAGGGGGDAGPADPCQACGDASCGNEWQACENDGDCSALLDCYDGCAEDEQCFMGCEEQHPDGTDIYWTFLDCLFGACSAECGG